jgi:hypothetical protein
MFRKGFVFTVLLMIAIRSSSQRGVNGKGGEPGFEGDGDSSWLSLVLFILIVGGIGYSLESYWKKRDSRKAEEQRAKAVATKEKEDKEKRERERKEVSKSITQIQKKDNYADLTKSTIRFGELEIMTKDLDYINFNEANKICQDLGNGWRLPTKQELDLIYENKIKIGGFASHFRAFYISSTDYENLPGFIWIKGFERGESGCFTKEDKRNVRLIRTL